MNKVALVTKPPAKKEKVSKDGTPQEGTRRRGDAE